MTDVRYWLWLSLRLAPGSSAVDLVLPHFSYDAKEIFKAKREDFEAISDLKPEIAEALSDKELEETKAIYQWCSVNNVGLLPYDSSLYPERLRRIPRAPLLLYYKGKLPDFDQSVCIAAVGTRRMTEYGRREGYVIARDLATGGAVVVSGMARGIDSICHRGALDAGGHTIAVLGCGINRTYPPENGELMDEIILKGTVITEYKPDTPPLGSNFPVRNRIISGLSQGTLVVEADEKSGAMITARDALRQGRDIFALPGKVGDQNSFGTNSLIQDGGKMVTNAIDILEEYEFYYPHTIHIERLPAFLPRFSVNPIKKSRLKVAEAAALLPEKKNERPPRGSHTADRTNDDGVKNGKSRLNRRQSGQPSQQDAADPTAVLNAMPAQSLSDENASPFSNKEDKDEWIGSDQASILEAMPKDAPISPDELAKKGFSVSDILSAMTMLEVAGLVAVLPGGLYQRLK